MFQEFTTLQQNCKFEQNSHYYANTIELPYVNYYSCKINHVKLINENETVTTYGNHRASKANGDVEMIDYSSDNIMNFIPNSLFTTFVNLKYVVLYRNFGMEDLKPEFLKNAKNLKVFRVQDNKITHLVKYLFVEAINLEYINLQNNRIESIDVMAFNKLTKLVGLFLDGNNIKNLFWMTFSELSNLRLLYLGGNTCINKNFNITKGNFKEVESKILRECENFELMLILRSIEKKVDSKFDGISSKFNNITDITKELNLKSTNTDKIHAKTLNHLVIGFFIVLVILGIFGIITLVLVTQNIKARKQQNIEGESAIEMQ